MILYRIKKMIMQYLQQISITLQKFKKFMMIQLHKYMKEFITFCLKFGKKKLS